MESFVDTTCRLGGLFAFGTALIEPIFADGGTTLLAYIVMDAAARSPYYTLYKELVVVSSTINNNFRQESMLFRS